MTVPSPARPGSVDPGGALLAVCGGYRCAGLHRSLVLNERESSVAVPPTGTATDPDRSDERPCAHGASGTARPDSDGLADLRTAVRSTTGAVLVLMPCMDSCSHGPVVGVGRHIPQRGPGLRLASPATLFGPVGDGPARRELRDWILSGAAGHSPPPALSQLTISPVAMG